MLEWSGPEARRPSRRCALTGSHTTDDVGLEREAVPEVRADSRAGEVHSDRVASDDDGRAWVIGRWESVGDLDVGGTSDLSRV